MHDNLSTTSLSATAADWLKSCLTDALADNREEHDLADVKPRRGLACPAEQKEMLPVRALEPYVLERKGPVRRALPAGPLDFNALE